METQFSRTELLVGERGVLKLKQSRVAVFGVGGVGGFAVEALARSGVGRLTLVDSDRVSLSNLNRQIIALHSTIGRCKTEVMRERILDINPQVEVEVRNEFYLPENADSFDLSVFDYVVDAVDTVSAKLELIVRSQAAGVPVISAMGAGNKLDPAQFRVSDISKTSVCPLARVMRRELRARGVSHVKVVWSPEEPALPAAIADACREGTVGEVGTAPETSGSSVGARSRTPGSVAFVPSVAGLVLAGAVVSDLLAR